MAGDDKKDGDEKDGWRLIPDGQKSSKSTPDKNERKKHLSQAQNTMKKSVLTKYTFVISVRSITTRETVDAANQTEAEKIIRDRYPFANVELVNDR